MPCNIGELDLAGVFLVTDCRENTAGWPPVCLISTPLGPGWSTRRAEEKTVPGTDQPVLRWADGPSVNGLEPHGQGENVAARR